MASHTSGSLDRITFAADRLNHLWREVKSLQERLEVPLGDPNPSRNRDFLPALHQLNGYCFNRLTSESLLLNLGQFGAQNGEAAEFCREFAKRVTEAMPGPATATPAVSFEVDSQQRQVKWLFDAADLVGCYTTDEARAGVYEPSKLVHPILWLYVWMKGSEVPLLSRFPRSAELEYSDLSESYLCYSEKVNALVLTYDGWFEDEEWLKAFSELCAPLVAIIAIIEKAKGQGTFRRREVPESVLRLRRVLVQEVQKLLFGDERQ